MEAGGHLYTPVTLTQEKGRATHLKGGWLGCKAGTDAVAMRKVVPLLPQLAIQLRSSRP